MHRTTLAEDEALLARTLAAIGHRAENLGSIRPWMRARLRARVSELGLSDDAYLAVLARDDGERRIAAERVATAMSRFFRGSRVLDAIARLALPELATAGRPVRAWSAGCARGEEAYTLAILWREIDPAPLVPIEILAGDIRADCIDRARLGVYEAVALRDVSPARRERWFEPHGGDFRVRDELRSLVRFCVHDLERDPWPEGVDLLLLRTVAFTYWDAPLRERAVSWIERSLAPGGWLALGKREELPPQALGKFTRVEEGTALYRRRRES